MRQHYETVEKLIRFDIAHGKVILVLTKQSLVTNAYTEPSKIILLTILEAVSL